MSDPAKETWTNLAQALGVTVRGLRDWRKLPGAPATPNVESWKSFVETNDLGLAGNRVGNEREELLCQKLRGDIKLQDLKIEKEQRRLVDIEEVSAFVVNLLLGVKQTCYQMARELPRQIIGDDLAEAQAKAEPYADEVMNELQGQIEKWWPKDYQLPEPDEGGGA